MVGILARQMLAGLTVFLICEFLILFARVMPVSAGDIGWPGPDLGLCLLFAWLLRRPDQIPAIAIALFFLMEDVLLLRPLGLWAGIVLIASEALRLREARWRDQPFVLEWFRVALLIGTMVLGYRFAQMLFLLPVPSFGKVMMQCGFTIASYPLVVFAARWLIGLRRISLAEQELNRYFQ